MRVAICQPTYLPWLGYFDLMDQVDTFVLLDNVQFEKQSWQQRNRIKTPTGLQWLTVPVIFRGKLGQLIGDVEIRDVNFGKTHLRKIELNYARAEFFSMLFPVLSSNLGGIHAGMRLSDLNTRLLLCINRILGITTPVVLASSLAVEGKRTHLLSSICRSLGASQYVSPIGSAEYLLAEVSIMDAANVETVFHHYVHPEYEQRFPPFLAFASIVDLIFNEGDRAMEIIRSGRRSPFTPDFVAAKMAETRQA